MKMVNVPGRGATGRLVMERLRGADFSSYGGNVDIRRSPEMLNMVSDRNGQPVKRCGYYKIAQYEDRINGMYELVDGEGIYRFVHTGDKLVLRGKTQEEDVVLKAGMADERSTGFQMGGALWLLDGTNFLCYGKFDVDGKLNREDGTYALKNVEDFAYIPTTVIARPPGTVTPGGESYEPVNLLQKRRINLFCVPAHNAATSGDKDVNYEIMTSFLMDFKPIDAIGIKAEILDANGAWNVRTDITVNAESGIVTFATAPGKTPIEGEDNVRITAAKTVSGYAERIKKSTIHTLYGVRGHNQVFLAGNPEYVNYQYYSEPDNPAYFPDVNFTTVGQDNTRIMGYQKSGQYLVIVKENNYQDATAFLMSGTLKEMADGSNKVVYTTQQGIAGVGAVSKYCFCDLRDDHLFLSEEGMFALVTNAITAEKFAQTRSALINKKLIEQNLAEAVATVYKGYLYVAVDGACYVSDAKQRHYEDKMTDTFQYEWYYWNNMPVRVWGEEQSALVFGAENGAIMRMSSGKSMESYQDDGKMIRAYWTTPILDYEQGDFYKTIQCLFTKIQPYMRSSVKIYMKLDGAWRLIDDRLADFFSFFELSFDRLSFNTNTDVLNLVTTINEKKVVETQFRFENYGKKEGFGLQNIAVHYLKKSKIK